MNSAVRIAIKVQMTEALNAFNALKAKLQSLVTQSGAVDKALLSLSDSMNKNSATAARWGTSVQAAGLKTGALVNPLKLTSKELSSNKVAVDNSATGLAALGQRLDATSAASIRWGRSVQQAGSAMTYAFTLPVVAGFYEVMKQERQYSTSMASLGLAMNQFNKDGTITTQTSGAMAQQMKQLDSVVIAVSNRFGISRVQVADNAAELARAGDRAANLAKDLALAEQVQRTYNITNATAVSMVLQLRTAFALTADETHNAVAALSVMQEQSRGTFDVLLSGIIRVAPIAHTFGMSVRQTAADLAQMAQMGYKGGESGNALAFSLGRLASPTRLASEYFKKLGLDVASASYQHLTGQQRLEALSQALKKVSGAQYDQASMAIFGMRQYAKMIPVLQDLTKSNSLYSQMLRSTSDDARNNVFFNGQLAERMKSPQAQFDLLKTNIQNAGRSFAVMLIPYALTFMHTVLAVAQALGSLSPGMKQLLTIGLVMLALAGPVLKVTGAFRTLFGFLVTGFAQVTGISKAASASQVADQNAVAAATLRAATTMKAAGAEISAEQVALAAESESTAAATVAASEKIATAPLIAMNVFLGGLLVVIVVFHKQVVQVFERLAYDLGYITGTIYHLLQWINPFATHSPSLVSQVSDGVDKMLADFGRLSSISGTLTGVGKVMQNVGNQINADSGQSGPTNLTGAQRAIDKHGSAADKAVFSQGVKQLTALNSALALISKEWDAQAKVVDKAKAAYIATDVSLKSSSDSLRIMKNNLTELQEAQKKMGTPASLFSQAQSMKDMARAVAETGNTDLANRFSDQASQLNDQAKAAKDNQTQIDELTKQIDAQQSTVDNLTAARDALLATYDAENAKLSDLKQGYSEIKAQADALTSSLMQLAAAATASAAAGKGKTDPLGGFNGAAGGAGVPSGADLGAGNSDLGSWLKNFQNQAKGMGAGLFGIGSNLAKQFQAGFKAGGTNEGMATVMQGWVGKAALVVGGVGALMLGKAGAKLVKGLFDAVKWPKGTLLTTSAEEEVASTEAALGAAKIGLGATLGDVGALTAMYASSTLLALAPIAGAGVLISSSLGAASKAAGEVIKQQTEWVKGSPNNLKTYDQMRSSLEQIHERATAATDGMSAWGKSMDVLGGIFGVHVSKVETANAVYDKSAAAINAVTAQQSQLGLNLVTLSSDLGLTQTQVASLADAAGINLGKATDNLTGKFYALQSQNQQNSQTLTALGDAYDTFHGTATTAGDTVGGLTQYFEALNSSMDIKASADKFITDIGSTKLALDQDSLSWGSNTQAAIDNRAGLKDLVTQMQAHAQEMAKQHKPMSDIQADYQKSYDKIMGLAGGNKTARDELDRLLTKMGYSPRQFAAFNGVVLTSSGAVDTFASSIKTAHDKMQDLINIGYSFAKIWQADFTPPVQGPHPIMPPAFPGAAQQPPGTMGGVGHAQGGAWDAGKWSWVGERGPELVRMGSTAGGHVYTNQQSMKMAGSGGNTTNNHNTTNNITVQMPTPSSDGMAVGRHIAFQLRGTS